MSWDYMHWDESKLLKYLGIAHDGWSDPESSRHLLLLLYKLNILKSQWTIEDIENSFRNSPFPAKWRL